MIKESSTAQSNFDMLCNDNIFSTISKYYAVEILMIVFFILGFIFHKKYLRQDKANNNLKINNHTNTDANTNRNDNDNDDTIRETLKINFAMDLNDLNNVKQTNHKCVNNTNNHSTIFSEIMNSNEYNKESKYSDKISDIIENNKKY